MHTNHDIPDNYRQLSVEKSEMEMTVTNSKKAALRMSQNVEELQWRINNHYELPANVIVERSKPNTAYM